MKIFCKDCCHIDKGLSNFCCFRKSFIKPNKGRYCQDFNLRIEKDKKESTVECVEKEILLPVVPISTEPQKPTITTKKISFLEKIKKFLGGKNA